MAGQKGVQDLSSEESDQIESWSQSEELSARRKIDTSVLSLLFLGLLVFQLDCMNFASALTGGFAENVSISHNTVNLGNQLMSFAIIVLEIPSKLILQRVCEALPVRL
ncbi:hypothetical protein B0J12DRAFT_254949 [Macrophomina phaseolina]|uniref:Major facilitator superfamily domain general substrate transporter n=1 Tax=Macrophomina phaseolina TaxID=35725 RepID=A0ABQ8G005_9PEZI|nr:hypothetical protein B0J12DRAFT_254949 [Macrophomina phaseolina]